MTKGLLSRDQIVAALEAVGAKLAARGTSTQLVLVGGAVALEPFLIRGKQRAARENLEDLWEEDRGPT